MRGILLLAALAFPGVCLFAAEPLPAIGVSNNGRYFVKADGTPFFWQADTAWSIFSRSLKTGVGFRG